MESGRSSRAGGGSHRGPEVRDLMNELSVRSATRADGNWVLAGRDFGNKE